MTDLVDRADLTAKLGEKEKEYREAIHDITRNFDDFKEKAEAALHAERERVRELKSENSAIRTLMGCYNIGGWTDAIKPMKRAEKAEAENKRLGNRDGNAHFELVLEKDGDPFYRIPLKIVDFGVADNIYVVESSDVQVAFTENATLRERLRPVEEVYKNAIEVYEKWKDLDGGIDKDHYPTNAERGHQFRMSWGIVTKIVAIKEAGEK